ncbi:ABC transporter permease [Bacillus sp. H-16]|uniref:ABC transporter permease n=1 Tax=Alteribacter salitolerans TaxID=2912333 RepID=UPI0019628182|nr:ABC transporter permease [Alteribacter salitolerans]MBM7095158.1 ABC transporter permease [Alteribacter salitolerans]
MRIQAMVKRICQEMVRDKRTLALLIVAPLLILSLMYFLFNSEDRDPRLGGLGLDERIVTVLEESEITVETFEEVSDVESLIVSEGLDGMLIMGAGTPELVLENSDPSASQALQMKVKQAMSLQAQQELMERTGTEADVDTTISKDYVYGSESSDFFDILSPVLIGFFVFFFVFLISGIGLLKERTSGTLERLLSTPIRRGEVVTAYLIGYGIFAIIQTVIVVLYSVLVLDIVLVGSLWHVVFINLLLALVALSLGTLLSTFAASEFQMVQFIPIAVIPQIFFSGIIPLEGMADWLQALGKVMPLYYGADALRGVMYKGLSLTDVSGSLYVLALFSIVFIVLNIYALKRYRKL